MGEVWGPVMFLGALALIFTGYPVAFALAGTALVFAAIGAMVGHFDLILLRALPDRTFGIMSNNTLLAVPFFIFMGTVLEKSRLAEDLLETIGILFGRFRGGLAIGVIGVGALLAAATGVVGASVGRGKRAVLGRRGGGRTVAAGEGRPGGRGGSHAAAPVGRRSRSETAPTRLDLAG